MEHNKNKAKQATGFHLQHYKHLDGLRGVASLVVVLYHMDVFRGGWYRQMDYIRKTQYGGRYIEEFWMGTSQFVYFS